MLTLFFHFMKSLVATIRKARPDVLQSYSVDLKEAIPEEMPSAYGAKDQVPDIGEPMLASFFTLSAVDPTNW